MQSLRRSSLVRFLVAPLTLVAWLSGCTKWAAPPPEMSPAAVVAEEQPDRVRITLANGTKLDAQHPVVEGDSLAYQQEDPAIAGKVALEDIEQLEIRKADPASTVLIGVTVLVVAAVAGLVLWESSEAGS